MVNKDFKNEMNDKHKVIQKDSKRNIHNIFQLMISLSLSLSLHNCILHEIWRMEENHREREREISFFLCFILTNPWMTWQCFFVVSVVVFENGGTRSVPVMKITDASSGFFINDLFKMFQ